GRFVAATHGGAVGFWDRNAPGRPLVIGPGPFGSLARHLAFTPEGRYVVVAGSNGTVSILPTPTTPPGPSRRGLWDEDLAPLARARKQAPNRRARETILAEAAPLQGMLEKLAEKAGDGQIQAELARHFAARGNTPLADAARAKARALLEAKLAQEPEN